MYNFNAKMMNEWISELVPFQKAMVFSSVTQTSGEPRTSDAGLQFLPESFHYLQQVSLFLKVPQPFPAQAHLFARFV